MKKVVYDYSKKYNKYTEEFKKDKAYVDANYVSSGSMWADGFKSIKENYNNLVEEARSVATEETKVIFKSITEKLNKKIAEGVAPGVVAELELLKTTKVTKDDIDAYLQKYYNNYLVCKVLKELAEKKEIQAEVLTLTDQMELLEDLKNQVIEFYRIYSGPSKSYKCELILNGNIIDNIDSQLKVFVVRYGIEV
ncbi:hypothetical protein [Clostridium algidicarnis]|uniref:hypothetical protein n=1 Tax=Clostridium algidicarnis TaxID=37659 RepID=UPI003FD7C0CB